MAPTTRRMDSVAALRPPCWGEGQRRRLGSYDEKMPGCMRQRQKPEFEPQLRHFQHCQTQFSYTVIVLIDKTQKKTFKKKIYILLLVSTDAYSAAEDLTSANPSTYFPPRIVLQIKIYCHCVRIFTIVYADILTFFVSMSAQSLTSGHLVRVAVDYDDAGVRHYTVHL